MKKRIINLFLIGIKSKKLLTMKLILLILTIGFTNISATVYSQMTKFSLQAENRPIVEVLQEIEQNSNFRFFYIREHVDVERRVTIKANNARVEEILDDIFKNQDIDYEVREDYLIILRPYTHAPGNNSSQDIVITGKVTDSEGSPLPGVNIYEKGTNQGTISDEDGNYSLSVSSENTTIVFSYVGFLTEEIQTNGRQTVDAILIEDIQALDEVVVIGYGKIKKSDLTGAVSSVKTEDISTAARTNVTQMLQGRASGVMISQQSAQPGGGLEFLIRGQTSAQADNQPLYIIDGIAVYNEDITPTDGAGTGYYYTSGSRNPLNTINPNDIESIEILKDASATAIYGARAANGVVLITTKQGEKGGVQVSYDGKYSSQHIDRYQEVLNAEEFMRYYDTHRDLLLRFSQGVWPYGNTPLDDYEYPARYTQEEIAAAGEGVDYFDAITRRGIIHDHNLSISGGNENTQVYSSFNYYDHRGVLINNDMSRFSGRLNVNQNLGDRIDFGFNLTGSQIDNNNAALGAGYWDRMPVIGAALGYPPYIEVYDTLGNYTKNELYELSPNPLSYNEIDDQSLETRWLGKIFTEVEIIDGLRIKPSFGFDNFTNDRGNYLPSTFRYGAVLNGSATRAVNKATTYLFETILSYDKTFLDNHTINSVAGYSYEEYVRENFEAGVSNFYTDQLSYNSLGTGSDEPSVSSGKNARRLASYFGRVNYSYQSKYLLTLTGRFDGSDKFGGNNKWAFFPSAAVGWNIANEDFMSTVSSTINSLKLRVSVGQTGNASIGDNAFAYYGPANGFFSYQFDDDIYTGVGKVSLENLNLKWETTTEYNFGLDYGLLSNRISGSIEVFQRDITDLLYSLRQQLYQQVGWATVNSGATQSRGFEVSLTANILTTSDMNWNINLNASRYVDRWTERSRNAIQNLDHWIEIDDYMRPVYSYVPDGIFGLDEDPRELPDLPGGNQYLPGMQKVKDLDSWERDENGQVVTDEFGRRIRTGEPDGRIDQADQVFRGTQDPELIYGFSSNFDYKNWDFSIAFNGMLNYWINDENFEFHVLRTEDIYGGLNRGVELKDAWTPDNQDGHIPTIIKGSVDVNQTGQYAQKYREISFLRLNSVTIGYTIPTKVLGTDVRVYVDGNNLLVFSNLKNMDPETIRWRDASQYNYPSSGLFAYPSSRAYTFGVNVNF